MKPMQILTKVAIVSLLIVTHIAYSHSAEIVEISSGLIRGEHRDHGYRYLGVPYAKPPVGDLRWRAPQPLSAWEGVRSAVAPGSACAQTGNFFTTEDTATFDQPFGSEDCLYLNIWRPETKREKRPLLIFFHGGSGIFGQAYHEVYEASRLSRETDAVVITANYRLGLWGSLHSAALHTGNPEEDSGNFLLLDMIRVIDWARENCAAFSCDPNNITIAGQSAGAVYVLALLRSPIAQGKFQKAISFSGVPFTSTLEKGEARTRKLLTSLLLQDGAIGKPSQAESAIAQMTRHELRSYLHGKSQRELLTASGVGLAPELVADGEVLALTQDSTDIDCSVTNPVPLMIGKTHDELSTLVTSRMYGPNFSELWPIFNGEARDKSIFKELGLFRGLQRNIVVSFLDRKFRKVLKNCIADYCEQMPAVYAYEFLWENFPDPWRSDFGSFHSLDVPFIFGNFVEDRKSYMRFAWTEETRAERKALHQKIASQLKDFLHMQSSDTDSPLGKDWQPWGHSKHIEPWDGVPGKLR